MNVSIKKRYERLTIMRWVARIASLLSILVLLMFLVGEEFDAAKITVTQWVGFVFFPIGLVAGFVIGWKNELLGGAVSIVSLFGFYVIYGLLLSNKFPRGFAFLVFSIPAFLFLATSIYAESAIGSHKKEKETETAKIS